MCHHSTSSLAHSYYKPTGTEKSSLIFSSKPKTTANFVMVIHGGAGAVVKEHLSPKREAQFKNALSEALIAGYDILKLGGSSLDAAIAAVTVMEGSCTFIFLLVPSSQSTHADCPLFNAGKGAVFNVKGRNELEASVMLSKPPLTHPHISPSRRGLGLTLLTHIKNPSHLARDLYLSPAVAPHVFLSGDAAESLCQNPDLIVDPSYFFIKRRWIEHRRGLGLPDTPFPPGHEDGDDDPAYIEPAGNTVGAVALDAHGCIATVTSTGGKTNKLAGRIGDSPICGAGSWAEEWKAEKSTWLGSALSRICPWVRSKCTAVGMSGTGDGDFFIRRSTGSTLGHRMKLLGENVEVAAGVAIEELRKDGGLGGLIALDSDGRAALVLNCPSMYRGVIRKDGIPKVAIFADDVL